MNTPTLSIGAVVQDPYGREGIVLTSESPPPKDWIDEQLKAVEIRALGPVQWWGVMPIGGGYLLFPEPMLKWVRQATFEDFLSAADTAGVVGRERLAKAFPDYLDRLLAERREPQ